MAQQIRDTIDRRMRECAAVALNLLRTDEVGHSFVQYALGDNPNTVAPITVARFYPHKQPAELRLAFLEENDSFHQMGQRIRADLGVNIDIKYMKATGTYK